MVLVNFLLITKLNDICMLEKSKQIIHMSRFRVVNYKSFTHANNIASKTIPLADFLANNGPMPKVVLMVTPYYCVV